MRYSTLFISSIVSALPFSQSDPNSTDSQVSHANPAASFPLTDYQPDNESSVENMDASNTYDRRDSGSDGAKLITDEMLQYHNEKRARHGAPPLQADKEAERKALEGVNCNMSHSKKGGGENISWGRSPRVAFDYWYGEGDNYDFSTSVFSVAQGHFTQIVWKGASKLGCALRNCPNGLAISCYYDSGNAPGRFLENVQRPN